MKSASNIVRYDWLVGIVPRLIPVGLCILGWYTAHLLGAIIGFIVGCLLGFVAWATAYYFLNLADMRKRRSDMCSLSDEQLKAIATNPTAAGMGFAMMELESRGIKDIHPSVESLLELLVSPNANTRALGYGLLGPLYPDISAKIAGEGTSSIDAPEVWRERIAALGKAN